MKRSTVERSRTLRVWKEHNRIIHNNEKTGCVCDEQPNRFRKGERVAGRCGNMHCQICYGRFDDKRMKRPTVKILKENERFAYELEEYYTGCLKKVYQYGI
jgi:hypothetical protein